MSPQDHPGNPTEVSDFTNVLLPPDGSDLPVVVGGHAVNLWSTYFLSRGAGKLTDYMPFMSKDLDLVGTMDLLEKLQRRFKGVVLRSEPRSPVFGRLEIPRKDGGVLKIEVLHTVNLLEEIREIVTSPNAEKAARLWGFDFPEVWPMEELRNAGDGKIARWLEHRFS